MFRSKNLLWLTFAAFCVTTGSCTVFYVKVEDSVQMDCAGADSKSDIEWKLNNNLLFYIYRTGRVRKGNSETSQRTRIEGNMLKIHPVKSIDFGEYTCKSSKHMLYVASAHANPSSVLYSGETKLSCDVAGDSKLTFHWLTPEAKLYGQEKEVTVKRLTPDHTGLWTCLIKNEKQENLIELKVKVNVVGPLITSENVNISEGSTAELPCSLPTLSGLTITEGSWTHGSPSNVRLAALMRTGSVVQWNQTGINTDKVGFTVQDLNTDFKVTLKKVRTSDAGVYVCSLVFGGGKSLSATLTLTVLKRDGSAPDLDFEGSTKVPKNMLYKPIWGMQLWVWISVLVSFFILIVLLVISFLIYCRNKRMKKKMKKLKSMRQPKNYCMCDRTRRQTGKSPRKKERPPPLPRHQYSSLNE